MKKENILFGIGALMFSNFLIGHLIISQFKISIEIDTQIFLMNWSIILMVAGFIIMMASAFAKANCEKNKNQNGG